MRTSLVSSGNSGASYDTISALGAAAAELYRISARGVGAGGDGDTGWMYIAAVRLAALAELARARAARPEKTDEIFMGCISYFDEVR